MEADGHAYALLFFSLLHLPRPNQHRLAFLAVRRSVPPVAMVLQLAVGRGVWAVAGAASRRARRAAAARFGVGRFMGSSLEVVQSPDPIRKSFHNI